VGCVVVSTPRNFCRSKLFLRLFARLVALPLHMVTISKIAASGLLVGALLPLAFSISDPVVLIEVENNYYLRSRDYPHIRGRGSSLLVSNKPTLPLNVFYRHIVDGAETWTQLAAMYPPVGDIVADQFGGGTDGPATLNYFHNMALLQTHIAGGVAMVGAAYADTATKVNTGAVYVYAGEWSMWSHQQTLTLENPNDNDFFGTSLVINQADLTTAVISCLGCDPFYVNSSATYIYRSEPPLHNRWSQQQVLVPTNKNVLYLGYGLTMHDNTMVISGSDRNDPIVPASDGWFGTGFQTSIYVFTRRPGSQHWTETQKLEGEASYGLVFSIGVEDDTIGIGNGRVDTVNWMSGYLKIYYPDTPRYSSKSKARSYRDEDSSSSHADINTNFVLSDIGSPPKPKPPPRAPQWSLQQILVDPVYGISAPYAFGSYFAFHGNSMVATRPIGYASRGLYIFERPFLGGQWSCQQSFQFDYSVDDFYPPAWYGTTILFGDSFNEIYTLSTSQEWSCLVISMEDAFGDGWGDAMILASAPDGTFDKYRPYCNTPNPMSFRYCPLESSDEGLYVFTIEHALKAKFRWEIQWQIYEEKTGLWYRGDHKTRMDFHWDESSRSFTRRGIVGTLPNNITCINNCKPKPTPKPTPEAPFRALKSSSRSHAPTITPAPTLAQSENTVWEYFSMSGSGWFDDQHRGTNYFISDIHGGKLISTGTKCDQYLTQDCWQPLPDGEYILRVTGYLNQDGGTREWAYCGRRGTSQDMLVFRVSDGQCDALEYFTRSSYCSNRLHITVADVTFILFGVTHLTEDDRESLVSSLSYLLTEVSSANIISITPSATDLLLEMNFHIPVSAYGYDEEDMSSIQQTYDTFMNRLNSFLDSAQLREVMATTLTASDLSKLTTVDIIENHIALHEVLPEAQDEIIQTFEPPVQAIPYHDPVSSSSTFTHYEEVTEKVLIYSGSAAGYLIFGTALLVTLFSIQGKIRAHLSGQSQDGNDGDRNSLTAQEMLETTGETARTLSRQLRSNAHSLEKKFVSFLDDIGDAVVDFVSPPEDEYPATS
jgi:hypothetical protein